MAQPPAYSPADFTSKEWNENRLADLDTEWAKIQAFADVVRTNLGVIQRDDTKLANSIVHKDAISPEVLALFATAWNPRGDWATATDYEKLDAVNEGNNTYICVTAHTSGTFATDLANELWLFVAATQSYNTDAEVETAYNNQVALASRAQAEDPSDTTVYRYNPQLLIQASRAVVSAADTGTDVYQMNVHYDVATNDVVTVDFGSANTTGSPTLENTGGTPAGAQSIVTTAGAAFVGMLEARPHRCQWNGTNFVVLDPAGGVVDKGSGANGTYVQYADGTLICRISGVSLSFDSTTQVNGTWTYPASFASTPVVTAAIGQMGSATPTNADLSQLFVTPSSSSALLTLVRISGGTNFAAGDTVSSDCIAIGEAA